MRSLRAKDRLVARATRWESSDLVTDLPDPEGFAWVRNRRGLIGWGTAARVGVGTGPDRFERADAALRTVFDSIESEGAAPVAFGSFTFDDAAPGSSLVVPAFAATGGRLIETGPLAGPVPIPDSLPFPSALPRIRYAGSSITEVAWLEAVDAAIGRIREGSLEKVVLARDVLVWAKTPFDNRLLARRLGARFPDCYTFIHGSLVGATPELLVRRRGVEVESVVLAGTAPRASRTTSDDAIGEGLLASGKDGEEHRLAVESVASAFDGFCDDFDVEKTPHLVKLANVQHLATTVRGRLRAPLSALQLAGALHPTAAVCGTPRAEAMASIRALEGMERGRYAGPVGWIDASGDGEFGIALRCAEVTGNRARLFAGNGIVAASRPEEELEETRLKLLAMQSALGG